MTMLRLFDLQLFVFQTDLGQLGLLLVCGALATLGLLLRQKLWGRVGPATRAPARTAGLIAAGAAAAVLASGLRMGPTSFEAGEPLSAGPLAWLVVLLCAAGVTVLAYAAGSGIAAAALSPGGEPKAPSASMADAAAQSLQSALGSFETLRAATAHLRVAAQEARARAARTSDGPAAAELTRTAESIAQKLELAEQLEAAAGGTVLRLACAAAVRRMLDARPDARILGLAGRLAPPPSRAEVETWLGAVRAFLADVAAARLELAQEAQRAPGSIAARVGLDPTEAVKPCEQALSEIAATYSRVADSLEAIRLRLVAEADSELAAKAAQDVAGRSGASAPRDLAAAAVELATAQDRIARVCDLVAAVPARGTEALVDAASALAREEVGAESLPEVLSAVREGLDGRREKG